jgi:hypothetical protein
VLLRKQVTNIDVHSEFYFGSLEAEKSPKLALNDDLETKLGVDP